MPEFTKTEKKIADVLSDGYRHRFAELLAAMETDELDRTALVCHVKRMRKKLVKSEDIICEFYQRTAHYRWVRLLPSATRG